MHPTLDEAIEALGASLADFPGAHDAESPAGRRSCLSSNLLELLNAARLAGADPCQADGCSPFQKAVHIVTTRRHDDLREQHHRLCGVHAEKWMELAASRQDLFTSAKSTPIWRGDA